MNPIQRALQNADKIQAANAELEHLIERCPACGNPIDYCQGHGEMGDPYGFAILINHDVDRHRLCHPAGCEQAGEGE